MMASTKFEEQTEQFRRRMLKAGPAVRICLNQELVCALRSCLPTSGGENTKTPAAPPHLLPPRAL